jgi:vacuolar-type H+-ATPase subunit I/STV1
MISEAKRKSIIDKVRKRREEVRKEIKRLENELKRLEIIEANHKQALEVA